MPTTSAFPSWLKETPLRFEDIARHHSPALTIYLPTINDAGDLETLSPENYDFYPGSGNNAHLATLYQWNNLAQESGIYHIPATNPPISLLWRTISGATLTLHCLDATRNRQVSRNRSLPAFEFRFPKKILSNCVGFARSSRGAVLYVLTEDCVLYTIPLPERAFSGEIRRESIAEDIITHRPLFLQARFGQGKLSLEIPHFMSVLNDSERIIFAMQDGTLHQYDPYGIAL